MAVRTGDVGGVRRHGRAADAALLLRHAVEADRPGVCRAMAADGLLDVCQVASMLPPGHADTLWATRHAVVELLACGMPVPPGRDATAQLQRALTDVRAAHVAALLTARLDPERRRLVDGVAALCPSGPELLRQAEGVLRQQKDHRTQA